MVALREAQGPLLESRSNPARRIDWWLVLSAVLLLTVGFMSLYSIDASAGASRHFSKQLLRLSIGLAPFALFFFVSPKMLFRYSGVLYVINLGLLFLVLVAGSKAGGAQRWLALGPIEFQPSEMAKLLTVITLAAFYARRLNQIKSFWTFALGLAHVIVPMVLIFKQPHLGATLVIVTAWLGVSIAAGIPARLIGAAIISVPILLVLAFYTGFLHQYQIDRLKAMGGSDVKGTNFQTHRALLAFASGKIWGVGYLKGEQKATGFVPEQQTDFIFTVIGEEGGLVGCLVVLGLFGVFFARAWRIMFRATDPFSNMVAAGIYSVLAFHTVVNVGMNLELLPVVGLWLPFMSYGGTALWLAMASLGLLLNLQTRARPVLF